MYSLLRRKAKPLISLLVKARLVEGPAIPVRAARAERRPAKSKQFEKLAQIVDHMVCFCYNANNRPCGRFFGRRLDEAGGKERAGETEDF